MALPARKSVSDARKQFSALLAAAERGRVTIITRYGRTIAAIVPADSAAVGSGQRPLTSLAGSGKGLWSNCRAKALRLRDEWRD